MKIIYWRWKNKKYSCLIKSFIQKENRKILELSDSKYCGGFPLLILRKEIEIVQTEEAQ